jgi:acyl-CoA synthetase (AMP-forming)/AMP-acid ligase II
LFARYLGAEPVTEHATGDTGYLDARGRVILTGRKKDMIIRGQHNIYPSLYEEHVLALAGVESCAFVGIADSERADERVVLAVEPKLGEDPQRLHERVTRALRSGACPIDAFAMPDEIVVCAIPHAGRASKPDRRALVAAVLERRAHGR